MSEARIIDGKAHAAKLRAEAAEAVCALQRDHGLTPGLAVVLVGEDPASAVYVRNKGEQTRAAGMHSVTHRLPVETTQDELLEIVQRLNADPAIHGILVQLPLPAHIDAARVLNAVKADKDVDGFSIVNAGRLAVGQPGLVPCTPVGCMILLRETLGELRGRHAVVIGRSNIVGKPMAQLLLQSDCTVTLAHSRTVDLPAICRTADILIAAVGRAEMVKADWIKPGATVIDVGMNRVPARDPEAAAAGKTRLAGDVDFEAVRQVAGAITPVPGGVGPMTIACLLRNTIAAACLSAGIPSPLA
jgi:methylenetetrahydrofolate dehydrogenase (NADP+)/methenyltetrahydrofolate cyclohydrolase